MIATQPDELHADNRERIMKAMTNSAIRGPEQLILRERLCRGPRRRRLVESKLWHQPAETYLRQGAGPGCRGQRIECVGEVVEDAGRLAKVPR
jgi:hypothetical protein